VTIKPVLAVPVPVLARRRRTQAATERCAQDQGCEQSIRRGPRWRDHRRKLVIGETLSVSNQEYAEEEITCFSFPVAACNSKERYDWHGEEPAGMGKQCAAADLWTRKSHTASSRRFPETDWCLLRQQRDKRQGQQEVDDVASSTAPPHPLRPCIRGEHSRAANVAPPPRFLFPHMMLYQTAMHSTVPRSPSNRVFLRCQRLKYMSL
jgi:hypothetical protein